MEKGRTIKTIIDANMRYSLNPEFSRQNILQNQTYPNKYHKI